MKLFISEGFSQWILPEFRKMVGSLNFYSGRGVALTDFSLEDKEVITNLLRYCMSSGGVVAGITAGEIIPIKNLINGQEATRPEDLPASRKERFIKDGFTITRIKPGMRADANYLFVQDGKGIDYYVHLSVIDNANWASRQRLAPNKELALKSAQSDSGKAPRAIEAWLID
jgi:hypothetical protein